MKYNGYKIQTIKDGEVEVTIDLIEDPKVGGYTVISPDYPEVVAQGESMAEGIKNFNDTLYDIQKYKESLEG